MSRTTRRIRTGTGAGEPLGHASSKSLSLRGRAASGPGLVITRGPRSENSELPRNHEAGPEYFSTRSEAIKKAKYATFFGKNRILGVLRETDKRMLELERKVSLLSHGGIWQQPPEVFQAHDRFDYRASPTSVTGKAVVVGNCWPWGAADRDMRESVAIAEPIPHKLDGPLDRTRFTLERADPGTLRESRRKSTLVRLGLDPDKQD